MNQEKSSKLGEIKDSIYGGINILQQLQSTNTHESIDKIRDTAEIAKEVIAMLKTPEMTKNIDNFKEITSNLNSTMLIINEIISQVKKTSPSAPKNLSQSESIVRNTNVDELELNNLVSSITNTVQSAKLLFRILKIMAV